MYFTHILEKIALFWYIYIIHLGLFKKLSKNRESFYLIQTCLKNFSLIQNREIKQTCQLYPIFSFIVLYGRNWFYFHFQREIFNKMIYLNKRNVTNYENSKHNDAIIKCSKCIYILNFMIKLEFTTPKPLGY